MNNTDILRSNADAVQLRKEQADLLTRGIIGDLVRIVDTSASDSDPVDLYRSTLSNDLCTREFAQFCRSYCKSRSDRIMMETFLPESVKIEPIPDAPRISYQQNPYSDHAFALFTRNMVGATATRPPSSTAVCEEVYYGRCDCCILPIYSSFDGILTTFIRLIEKYDLKINATCDVIMPDGESVMRFALLRHELTLPVTAPCYVQINAILPELVHLGAFLSVCEEVGASITEMITLPLAYTMENTSYNIRLQIPQDNLTPLLMLLRATLDNYSLEGIFTIIQ